MKVHVWYSLKFPYYYSTPLSAMHVITYLNNKSTLYTFHGLNKQTCIFFLQPILQSNHLKKKKDYEMYILAIYWLLFKHINTNSLIKAK